MSATPRPNVPSPGGRPPSLFGRSWTGFRGLPVWAQVLVWAVAWPVLAALYLVSATRPSAGRVMGAAALLLLVTPVWAGAITGLGVADDTAELTPEPGPEPGPEPEPDPPPATPPPDPESEPDAGPDAESDAPGSDTTTSSVTGELEIHYLDVGQGDATLLLHDEVAVLIDVGTWQGSELVPMLRDRGVEALDLLVVTHPHADHIGQFDQVMDALAVDEVWWSGSVTTSQTFERAVAALERSDAAYEEPREGDRATLGPLDIEVINPPDGVDTSDLHDAGLGLLVTYGEVRMLFTGDAEAATENRMVSRSGAVMDADILQLGHHGSRTSTTPSFLAAVDPALAIYSAGADNQYGHPHGSVLERVRDAGIDLYGTDVHGTVLVTTDGTSWSVATESAGEIEPDRASSEASAPRAPPPPPPPPAPPGACAGDQVDVNTADVDELQRIHQIGPERAEEILALRPFSALRDMDRISGIGPARVDEILAQGVACVG